MLKISGESYFKYSRYQKIDISNVINTSYDIDEIIDEEEIFGGKEIDDIIGEEGIFGGKEMFVYISKEVLLDINVKSVCEEYRNAQDKVNNIYINLDQSIKKLDFTVSVFDVEIEGDLENKCENKSD